MRLLISCELYKPYLSTLLHEHLDMKVIYLDVGSHVNPMALGKSIQHYIDAFPEAEEVVLLYGICGNATQQLRARNGTVYLPKFHDCAGILLGSNAQFLTHFSHRLSSSWKCLGHKSITHDASESDNLYIWMVEMEDSVLYEECIKGSLDVIKEALRKGPKSNYVALKQGEKLKFLYDFEEVIITIKE